MAEERLQKYMAECGIASRRKSEELIREGKVRVNGEVAEIGRKIDPKKDVVSVEGRKVQKDQKHVYLMLNKPRGFISTMSDEYDRRCVAELVADVDTRVYPVGRLDRDSEGLLLFTNDGEFANSLMHPSKHVPKTYRVTVRPEVTDDMITKMMTGMMIDGQQTLPADVKVLVKAFLRKGSKTPDYVDGKKFQRYSKFWMKVRPARRWLLAVWRRLPMSVRNRLV